MTPYYEVAGITIYHGDCREVLPMLPPVDLLLTDPPYGIGEARGKNTSRSKPFGGRRNGLTHDGAIVPAKDYGVAAWDNTPVPSWLLQQAIAKARHAVVWGGNYYHLPPSSCWLVWDKDNSGDFADCELAWTNLDKAVRRINWRWNGMLQEDMAHKEPRYHPTQKPEAVMLWAIQQTPIGMHRILDPFMGSGTTLVAAKRLGREAIGIELDERYCEVAATRLAQGALDLFGEASA